MNELIKYFNKKYGKEYGKISYPRTTIQIYKVYQAIKSYGIKDEELVKLLHNVKLPKPKSIEEKELYTDCLYNKDDSEIEIDTNNLTTKEYVDTSLKNKVDKVTGKGLSTVDFTTAYETKLKKLENYNDTTIKKNINDINTQLGDIANKIDEITSSGGSGGSSGETTTSDYDTEISLPFTASKDTDVKVVFSKGDEISNPSYTNEVASLTENAFTITKAGNPSYTVSKVTEAELQCMKVEQTGTGYVGIKSNSENTFGDNKWFCYYKFKLIKDSLQSYTPSIFCSISTNLNCITGFDGSTIASQFDANSSDWQELCCAGQVNQIDVYKNQKSSLGFLNVTGELYINKLILVNLTEEGLEGRTKAELLEMVANGQFDNSSGSTTTTTEFSCTVTNGSTTEDITPFTDTDVTKYYTVTNGSTLSIKQRTGYGMPSTQALIKTTTTSTVEIEDSELKLNTRFKGKKVAFEGDSITDYDYLEGYNNKSWANYLSDILGTKLVSNRAVGGSILTYTSGDAENLCMNKRINSVTYDNDIRLFCIHIGTNDYAQNKLLGDVDSTDISTICGSLNNVIDKIQTDCPKAAIVVISPIHRQYDEGGQKTNSAGIKFEEYGEIMEKVCKRWGVKFKNGFELGLNTLNTKNLEDNYIDGLHPTPKGHKIIAVEMAREIATF